MGFADHVVLDKNRRPRAQGQGDGVRRPGIENDFVVAAAAVDGGVKCVVPDVRDYDAFDGDAELGQQALHQVVGHGARGGNVFNDQGDGIGFEHADPDR